MQLSERVRGFHPRVIAHAGRTLIEAKDLANGGVFWYTKPYTQVGYKRGRLSFMSIGVDQNAGPVI